jgi:hypothetical protein
MWTAAQNGTTYALGISPLPNSDRHHPRAACITSR